MSDRETVTYWKARYIEMRQAMGKAIEDLSWVSGQLLPEAVEDVVRQVMSNLDCPPTPTEDDAPTLGLLDADRMEAWLRSYHPAAVAARNDGTEWTEEDEHALRTLLHNMSDARLRERKTPDAHIERCECNSCPIHGDIGPAENGGGS